MPLHYTCNSRQAGSSSRVKPSVILSLSLSKTGTARFSDPPKKKKKLNYLVSVDKTAVVCVGSGCRAALAQYAILPSCEMPTPVNARCGNWWLQCLQRRDSARVAAGRGALRSLLSLYRPGWFVTVNFIEVLATDYCMSFTFRY